MCRRVECPKCKKPSFAGCGMHVEQVLGDVPRDQRCQCSEAKSKNETTEDRSLWRRLVGG
jgi:hypothetical protein